MPAPNYPYLPPGRAFKYVPADHPFMQAAEEARRTLAGDRVFPVGAVLVKDGAVVTDAGNGWSRGRDGGHVCPRFVRSCPTGTGYDLCGDFHEPSGHAEPMLIKRARKCGIDPAGADVYMNGHWWCCEPCWQAMIDAGIRDVYLLEDAHGRFSKEVLTAAMRPSIRSIYVSGGLTNLPDDVRDGHKAWYERIGAAAEELGVRAYVPHLHSDPERHAHFSPREVYDMDVAQVRAADAVVADVTYPSLGTGGGLDVAHAAGKPIILVSKKDSRVTRYTRGIPSVVYHIEYETEADGLRQLQNVLKQL